MLKFQKLVGITFSTLQSLKTHATKTIVRHGHRVSLEPEYLDTLESRIPFYSKLNVQLKGYDFTVLEDFSGYVHKTAENMEIEVEECWATPCKNLEIQVYKPASTLIKEKFYLNVYERNIQISNVKTTVAPLFIEIIQTALPEGVELNIKPHKPEDDEVRYVPDLELKGLKSQLEELSNAKK
nr:EOG090X0MUO [Cyclestheria hislopi]